MPLHPWAWPEKQGPHRLYAGPFEGRMFLLAINAHSKWLEIHACRTSTSATTIESLRKSFVSLGLPQVIVSDNAQACASSEFAQFLHIRTPPYHPASNRLVERAVQTFKEGLKEGTVETRLARLLFKYRVIPHSSTGTSPSELMVANTIGSTPS